MPKKQSTITKAVREDLGEGNNISGWKTAQVFYEYTGHVFVPKLGQLNVIHIRALINIAYNKTKKH